MKSNADMRSSKKLVYIQNVNTMCFAKSETFFIFQLSTFFSVKGFTPNVMLTCNSFYYRYKLRVHVNLISLNTLVSLHFWGEYNTDMKNAHWVHAGTYCNVFSYIWQGIRSMTHFCSKIGWKWKWSGKCRKSEISLIWCISTTNKVKSCKKFNETANFTDFSLISCGNGP